MTATAPMTTVSVCYGGVQCPTEQVVRLALPSGHKVTLDGKTVEDGTEAVFVVRTKPSPAGTSGYANLYMMAPGVPQLIGGCYVHAKARGKGRWVEWDGCRDVAEFVTRFILSRYVHSTAMPRGFTLAEQA